MVPDDYCAPLTENARDVLFFRRVEYLMKHNLPWTNIKANEEVKMKQIAHFSITVYVTHFSTFLYITRHGTVQNTGHTSVHNTAQNITQLEYSKLCL